MNLKKAYETLGLSFGAPLPQVRRAFRDEAQLYHPDKLGDVPERVRKRAEDRFKRINEAQQTIHEFAERFGELESSSDDPWASSRESAKPAETQFSAPKSDEAFRKFMEGEFKQQRRWWEEATDSIGFLNAFWIIDLALFSGLFIVNHPILWILLFLASLITWYSWMQQKRR